MTKLLLKILCNSSAVVVKSWFVIDNCILTSGCSCQLISLHLRTLHPPISIYTVEVKDVVFDMTKVFVNESFMIQIIFD